MGGYATNAATISTPRASWLRELWMYRELLYFFAWRDIKVRYKQAALGVAWAVMQPLLTMIVFTVLFGQLAGIRTDGIPHPLFYFAALLPWTYFTATVSAASNSLVGNSNLLTKVYFPRVLLPASSAVSAFLDFLIGAMLLAGLLLYYRVVPQWPLLLAPIAVIGMILLATGIGLLLAALNVRYRDVKYTVPFLLQLWLFVTPVIYPVTAIPERYRPLLALNPCWGLVEGFRACLFPSHSLNVGLLLLSLATATGIFLTGVLYFHRTERAFADIV